VDTVTCAVSGRTYEGYGPNLVASYLRPRGLRLCATAQSCSRAITSLLCGCLTAPPLLLPLVAAAVVVPLIAAAASVRAAACACGNAAAAAAAAAAFCAIVAAVAAVSVPGSAAGDATGSPELLTGLAIAAAAAGADVAVVAGVPKLVAVMGVVLAGDITSTMGTGGVATAAVAAAPALVAALSEVHNAGAVGALPTTSLTVVAESRAAAAAAAVAVAVAAAVAAVLVAVRLCPNTEDVGDTVVIGGDGATSSFSLALCSAYNLASCSLAARSLSFVSINRANSVSSCATTETSASPLADAAAGVSRRSACRRLAVSR
jgi:hypothetical protein